MIKEVCGSIVEADADAIAHVANCFCVMGAGVAKAIADKFPEAKAADKMTTVGSLEKFGKFSVAATQKPNRIVYVYNLYAQYTLGGLRELNYEKLYTSLLAMKQNATEKGITTIAIPYQMGSGLSGGNWRIVSTMVEEVFKSSSIKIVIYKLDAPKILKHYTLAQCLSVAETPKRSIEGNPSLCSKHASVVG